MEIVESQPERHWTLRMADVGWGAFYARFDWKPITDYDGHSMVLLRSPVEHFLGANRDGEWCVLSAGDYTPIEDFEPTSFAEVTDEQLAMLLD